MKASTPDKELDVRFLQIDLQSLGSVDEAARKFKATESRLHILVANAGVSFFIRLGNLENRFQMKSG